MKRILCLAAAVALLLALTSCAREPTLQEIFEEQYGKELTRIRLEIEPNNDGARRLYTRLGYQRLGYEQMYKEFGAAQP